MGAETPTRMGGRKKGSKVIRREGRREEEGGREEGGREREGGGRKKGRRGKSWRVRRERQK